MYNVLEVSNEKCFNNLIFNNVVGDVKKIYTRRYMRIKPIMGRKRILKMDTRYPRVRVFLISAF